MTTTAIMKNPPVLSRQKVLIFGVPLALCILVSSVSFFAFPSVGIDWHNDIGPAARHPWPAPWAEGHYGLPLPPWSAVILSPLGLLPDRIATAVVNALSTLTIFLLVQRFGGPWWAAVPVIISAPALNLFINGQSEWLIMLGLLLPAAWGFPLVILKPQVAGWVLLSKLRRAGKDWIQWLLPLAGISLLSLAVWGFWPLAIQKRYTDVLISGWWNRSLWPWSIPVGLFFLWKAWQTRQDEWALLASPLLFPYVNMQSYVVLTVILAARLPLAACILAPASWIVPFQFLLPIVGVWQLLIHSRRRLSRSRSPASLDRRSRLLRL